MDEETQQLFLFAIKTFESRLTSIEVAQQFIAAFLHDLSPEDSKAMAEKLRAIAQSGHRQIDTGASNYIENLALHLEGDPLAQIFPLLHSQLSSRLSPEQLRTLLRVIDGGVGIPDKS